MKTALVIMAAGMGFAFRWWNQAVGTGWPEWERSLWIILSMMQ